MPPENTTSGVFRECKMKAFARNWLNKTSFATISFSFISLVYKYYVIICDALHNLVPFAQFKKVKNTHGEVKLAVKLKAVTLLKVSLLHECFSRFLNYKNGTKSLQASCTVTAQHITTQTLVNFQIHALLDQHICSSVFQED